MQSLDIQWPSMSPNSFLPNTMNLFLLLPISTMKSWNNFVTQSIIKYSLIFVWKNMKIIPSKLHMFDIHVYYDACGIFGWHRLIHHRKKIKHSVKISMKLNDIH
jgi:hypothetical protein